MTTSNVMFVPKTKRGILLKKLKEMEEKLCILTGFKIKYAESGGTPLANMFSEEMGMLAPLVMGEWRIRDKTAD